MAQNSLQEMIDKLRASQKVNQMTPEQKTLGQQLYERTQPIAGQGAISGLSSSQKRKLRWSNAKDAGKGALSSIYGAATFIPETLARIGTAGIDQIAGTDTQSKLDQIANYVPNKLRKSSSNTKAFDKGQEYTDDALMAAALLTAGATGPKSPKARLQDLNKNPLKYNAIEAGNIVRAAEDAGIESIKSGKTRLTPKQIDLKAGLNREGELKRIQNENYNFMEDMWQRPAYQQKLFSQVENLKNGTNMETFRDIPANRTSTYGPNKWYDNETLRGEYHPLGDRLSDAEVAELRKYLENEKGEGNYNPQYEDAVERGLYEFQDAERAAANTSRARAKATKKRNTSAKERAAREADEVSFAIESLIEDDVYPIRVKDVQERLNTSRARANATKKRNMSAKERAARERAEDSAHEKAVENLRNEVENMSLEDMYKLWKSQQNG